MLMQLFSSAKIVFYLSFYGLILDKSSEKIYQLFLVLHIVV